MISSRKEYSRSLTAHFLNYDGSGGTRFDAPRVGCQDLLGTKKIGSLTATTYTCDYFQHC